MAPILVVCTGNIVRSPMGEGFLRACLEARIDDRAPEVRSAGTYGWDGSPPVPEAVDVAQERGVDISQHIGRRLETKLVDEATVVVGMCAEHRDAAARMTGTGPSKAFTLKELTRILEELPPATAETDLATRIAEAAALRKGGFEGLPADDDVIDPLGMPYETFRSVGWEINEWCERMATGLVGPPPPAPVSAAAPDAVTEGEA